MKPEGNSSLRTGIGAALVGLALIGGSLGATVAQEASPAASPAAVADWVSALVTTDFPEVTGDSTSVGIVLNDAASPPLAVNAGTFETRPFVQFPTTNKNDAELTVVLFSAPEGFDATTFTIPASEADLPEGVTPVSAWTVAPGGTQTIAVFPDLAPGTYVVASSNGLAASFVVTEAVDLGVPDIFATPTGG
jgi:hypothetical protein